MPPDAVARTSTTSPGLSPTASRTFLGSVTWPFTVIVVTAVSIRFARWQTKVVPRGATPPRTHARTLRRGTYFSHGAPPKSGRAQWQALSAPLLPPRSAGPRRQGSQPKGEAQRRRADSEGWPVWPQIRLLRTVAA